MNEYIPPDDSAVYKEAMKQVMDEEFEEEVKKCKERILRNRVKWWHRVFPYRLVRIDHDQRS